MLRTFFATALILGTLAAGALGARPATPGEARQITRGVQPFIVANSAEGMSFTVSRVVVSTANRSWARLQVSNPAVGVATVVARKMNLPALKGGVSGITHCS